MSKVLSVNISEKKGVVKHPVNRGYFEVNHGLVGDAHAGTWHRQVSLLAQESIAKLKVHGIKELSPGDFAENITTGGLILYKLPVGTRLKIGKVLLEITQIGKECHTSCEIRNIVGDCVMPREGIFARVLSGGWIQPEDEIEIV